MEGIWLLSYALLWLVVVLNLVVSLGLVRQLGLVQLRPQNAPSNESQALEVGELAPAFSASSHAGEDVSLESLRGKWTLLFFVNPTCESCTQSLRQALSGEELAHGDIDLVAVAAGTQEDSRGLAEAFDNRFPVLVDGVGRLAASYHVPTRPYCVLLDPNGRVRLRERLPDGGDTTKLIGTAALQRALVHA